MIVSMKKKEVLLKIWIKNLDFYVFNLIIISIHFKCIYLIFLAFFEILIALKDKEIIGFDVMETATDKLGDITAITASKFIYDFLSLMGIE